MRALRRFTVRTVLPASLAPLGDLALNLRWSWHPPTRALFASLDPARWEEVHHDPIALLGALGTDRLEAAAADRALVERVQATAADLQDYLARDRWYQGLPASAGAPGAIAYFSAEFGITSVLPQYSGGLGILAGDHLKAASDLGVPVVGVGLLYKTGYFSQGFSADGWQTETYPAQGPEQQPLTLLREADGTAARVSVQLPEGRTLDAHVWRADVGRVPLLLLDSDVPGNDEAAAAITDRLYGGGGDHRLQQEMLLGIGGVRALRLHERLTGAVRPEVYHCNEGHAGFLGLERVRELVEDDGGGLDVPTALEAVRSATVFTTHTPVPAGIDRFGVEQVRRFLGCGVLGALPVEAVLPLGREDHPGGDPSVFNMAVMGFHLSQRANGVSALHGEVSRGMFSDLWPGFDAAESPITSITNGVHAPTWVDARVCDLLAAAGGGEDVSAQASAAPSLDPAQLWAVRRELREQLVHDARARVRASWLKRGSSPAELGWVDDALDPDVLTIGFARRVPTYKRLTLMLRDPARLKALLLHPTRPVQLVIAGKSHPADDSGKALLQQMVQFADAHDVRHRIVVLPDYDIGMAQLLYPGCDVWLNNPLRPLEACGTSGMKAALNGCLNLSILDGWWDEWFDPEFGWAIPTADGVADEDRRDALEAAGLYDLIEQQVAARFYDRDASGLPQRWLSMVTHTLTDLAPKVQATRMVQDYVERLYVPAAVAGASLAASGFAGAKDLAAWKERVLAAWPGVRVDHVDSEGVGSTPEVGDVLTVSAWVSLGALEPDDVVVQVVHGRVGEDDELVETSTTVLPVEQSFEEGRHHFSGDVTLRTTGAFGYTVRVLPHHAGQASDAETALVAVAA